MKLLKLNDVISDELNFLDYSIVDIDTIENEKLKKLIERNGEVVSKEEVKGRMTQKEEELKKQIDIKFPIYDKEIDMTFDTVEEYLFEKDVEYFNLVNLLIDLNAKNYLDLSTNKQDYYKFVYWNFVELRMFKLV